MFPRDTYKFIDKTFNVEQTGINTGITILQGFVSEKGDDSNVFDFASYEHFINNYGEPNMQMHGQAIYHVAEALESRNAIVKGKRITAKNAVYSNVVLVLEIIKGETQKVDAASNLVFLDDKGLETIIDTGIRAMVPNATVGLALKTIKPANDKLTLKQQLEILYEEDPAGLYTIPLILFKSNGKGVYGNGFRFKLKGNLKADSASTFRNYDLDATYTEKGVTKPAIPTQLVSLYTNAKNRVTGRSMNMEDVIDNGDYPIEVIVSDIMYSRAINALSDIFANIYTEYHPEEIDLINFLDENGRIYKYITVDSSSVDVSKTEGVAFVNGSDGDFAETNPTRMTAISERLIEFYSGAMDASILDPREHQFKILMDAGHPIEVKRAMQSLYAKRKDFALALDLALISTESEAFSALKDMEFNSHGITINTQNFAAFDKYTGKNQTFTGNYLFAKLLPTHIAMHGTQTPFAGIDIPLDPYIIKGSLKPIFSEEGKLVVYEDLRANYIHKEAGKLVFGTNITTQQQESEMLYFNNVLVMLEMAEDLRSLGSMFRWKFSGSDEDFRTLNKIADSKIDKYRDVKCKVANISVTKDSLAPNSKRVKCSLSVGFRNFILATDAEFFVELF